MNLVEQRDYRLSIQCIPSLEFESPRWQLFHWARRPSCFLLRFVFWFFAQKCFLGRRQEDPSSTFFSSTQGLDWDYYHLQERWWILYFEFDQSSSFDNHQHLSHHSISKCHQDVNQSSSISNSPFLSSSWSAQLLANALPRWLLDLQNFTYASSISHIQCTRNHMNKSLHLILLFLLHLRLIEWMELPCLICPFRQLCGLKIHCFSEEHLKHHLFLSFDLEYSRCQIANRTWPSQLLNKHSFKIYTSSWTNASWNHSFPSWPHLFRSTLSAPYRQRLMCPMRSYQWNLDHLCRYLPRLSW